MLSDPLHVIKNASEARSFRKGFRIIPTVEQGSGVHHRVYLHGCRGNLQGSGLKVRRKSQISDETIRDFRDDFGQIHPSIEDQSPPRGTPSQEG